MVVAELSDRLGLLFDELPCCCLQYAVDSTACCLQAQYDEILIAFSPYLEDGNTEIAQCPEFIEESLRAH